MKWELFNQRQIIARYSISSTASRILQNPLIDLATFAKYVPGIGTVLKPTSGKSNPKTNCTISKCFGDIGYHLNVHLAHFANTNKKLPWDLRVDGDYWSGIAVKLKLNFYLLRYLSLIRKVEPKYYMKYKSSHEKSTPCENKLNFIIIWLIY